MLMSVPKLKQNWDKEYGHHQRHGDDHAQERAAEVYDQCNDEKLPNMCAHHLKGMLDRIHDAHVIDDNRNLGAIHDPDHQEHQRRQQEHDGLQAKGSHSYSDNDQDKCQHEKDGECQSDRQVDHCHDPKDTPEIWHTILEQIHEIG